MLLVAAMRCERCECEIFGRITPDMEPLCVPCIDSMRNRELLRIIIFILLFMLAIGFIGGLYDKKTNQVQRETSSSKAVLRVHPDN